MVNLGLRNWQGQRGWWLRETASDGGDLMMGLSSSVPDSAKAGNVGDDKASDNGILMKTREW